MTEIQPFRGFRYDVSQVGSLSDVIAPPYDVIDADAQQQLYKRHACNVVRLILNRQEPGDAGPDERYNRAAKFLRNWQSDGILQQEREEALYVYHQQFQWEGTDYVRRGFLGRLRLEEFGQGSVYPHEQTMSGPKADRLALTKACRMNLSPIFSLYPDAESAAQDPLESAIRSITPLEATDELGIVHRMWPVTDQTVIANVQASLADKSIFIADGHHRYETALNYRNWLRNEGRLHDDAAPPNFVMMHFVGMSDPGLAILPTHRLLSGLPELTARDLQSVLADCFEFEEMGTGADGALQTWEMMEADGAQNVFGFGTIDGHWQFARLTDTAPMQKLAAEQSENWRQLGVSILHRLVIDSLIAERYPNAELSCRYVHRLDEVTAAQAGKTCGLACLVAPAGIEHIEQIAAKLEKMPPKSTYFYPKLLSGLVFHPLN